MRFISEIISFKRAFVIVFLAVVAMRLYGLGQYPASFHRDEVANAYVGKYIIKNGFDMRGNNWPLLYFDKVGDYPPVIPMYVSALGTLAFGNNIFGSRVMIAIASMLTSLMLYIYVKRTFDRQVALLTMLFFAFSMWEISFSRVAAEGVLGLLVFLAAHILCLRFLDSGRTRDIVLGTTFALMTYLLYPSYRILVPIYFGTLIIVTVWSEGSRHFFGRKCRSLVIATILTLTVTAVISQTQWGRARFEQTSVLGATASSNPQQAYVNADLNITTARLFNNKYSYIIQTFTVEYLKYFSPQFLFIDEARPDWFGIPRTSLLQGVHLVGLLGFFLVYLRKKALTKYSLAFILLWIVMPIPSALTTEYTPNAHRAFGMHIFYIAASAQGVLSIIGVLSGKWRVAFVVLFFAFFAAQTSWGIYNYFVQLNIQRAVIRDDGLLQAGQYLARHRKDKKIYMFNSSWYPLYYLFASDIYPKDIPSKMQKGFAISEIDNIRFSFIECPTMSWFTEVKPQDGARYVVHKDCVLPDAYQKKLKFDSFIDGQEKRHRAFAVYI